MRDLSAATLRALPEWQMVEAELMNQVQSYIDDIMIYAQDGETAKVQEAAGRVAMIREVLALPERLFPDKASEDA